MMMHHVLQASKFSPPDYEPAEEGAGYGARYRVQGTGELRAAFEMVSTHQVEKKGKAPLTRNYYVAHPLLAEALLLGNPETLRHRVHAPGMPMLVPPLRWERAADGSMVGGFLHQRATFIRTRYRQHVELLRNSPQGALDPVVSIYACAHMHVHMAHMHAHMTEGGTLDPVVSICICTHAHMHMHMHTCTCVCTGERPQRARHDQLEGQPAGARRVLRGVGDGRARG